MRVLKALEGVVDGVVRLMTFGIALLMFVEVMVRMFFPDYILTWQEEVARAMYVYVTVIGGALALRERGHFTMSMVVRRFPPVLRRAVTLLCIALILAFSGVWLVTSIPWVQSSANTFTPALQWDFRLIYAAFPIGSLLMTAYALVLLVEQWRSAEPMELGHSEVESEGS